MDKSCYIPIIEINDDGKLLDVEKWAVSIRYHGAFEEAEKAIEIALQKYCEDNNCQIKEKNTYSTQEATNGFNLSVIAFVEKI